MLFADNSKTEALISGIRAGADNIGGHAAFTSMLFSGPELVGMREAIMGVDDSVNVKIVIGAVDPWCGPSIGRIFSRLFKHASYYEIQNCGHCPQTENVDATSDIICCSECEVESSESGKGGFWDGIRSFLLFS